VGGEVSLRVRIGYGRVITLVDKCRDGVNGRLSIARYIVDLSIIHLLLLDTQVIRV